MRIGVLSGKEVAFASEDKGDFDGTGLFSSGLIGVAGGEDLPGGTKYSMTFSKAGVYKYVCAVHEPLGMVGTITVWAR